MFDGKAFGEEIVSALRGYVDKAIVEQQNVFKEEIRLLREFVISNTKMQQDVNEALKEAVDRPVPELPDIPKMIKETVETHTEHLLQQWADWQERSVNHIATTVKSYVADIPLPKDGAAGKDGIDGKDGKDGKDAESFVLADFYPAIEEAVKALPPAKDGINGKDGADGKSVTLEEVIAKLQPDIDACLRNVEERIDAIPLPKDGKDGADGKDGKSITVEDVKITIEDAVGEIKSVIENEVSLAVARIPPAYNGADGKDGVGVAGALIDVEGQLNITLSNGEVKKLGKVMGPAGADGRHGTNGKDGVDGIGFDDMSAEVRDDGLWLVWTKGEVIKEARVPSIMYRDVWNGDTGYKVGEVVTWGGNMWIAKTDGPVGKPDAAGGNKDWKLCAKKGRDGRDGRDGKDYTKPVKLEEK
jgi:integrin beta 3